MPQNIVSATTADINKILEIERNSFAKPWTEKMFTDTFKNNAARFKAAVSGGEISGYIIYWVLPGETSILNIAVSKEHRNKTVAKQLLNYMEADSIKNNSKTIFLEVRPSNVEALGLYTNSGYKQIGIRKKYYITEDALILQKQL